MTWWPSSSDTTGHRRRPHPAAELYRYAQVLSLIEGPLRIAGADFPDRQWMLDLAERNIAKALNAV